MPAEHNLGFPGGQSDKSSSKPGGYNKRMRCKHRLPPEALVGICIHVWPACAKKGTQLHPEMSLQTLPPLLAHTHTKTHQKYKQKYTCSGDLLRFSTRQDSRCIIQTAAPSATLFIKIYKKYFHCADYTPICQSMTKHSIIHRKDWQRMSGRKKVRAT